MVATVVMVMRTGDGVVVVDGGHVQAMAMVMDGGVWSRTLE